MADHYLVSPGNPSFPDKAHFIGLLTGNWRQMGWEAGRRGGDSIRVTSNVMWDEIARKCGVEKAPAEIKLYEDQLRAFMPEWLQFVEGLAEGAEEWLSRSEYARVATNYERVLIGSIYHEITMYHPPATDGGCSAFAAKGPATVNGVRLHTHNRHTQYNPLNYEQVYVAKPDNGNTFWVLCNLPAAIGNQVVNDKGVSVALLAGGGATNPNYPRYVGEAFGVSGFVALAYIAAYANTAQEAIEILTKGHAAYREATGRNSLLRTGVRNYLVSDRDMLAVVEVSPDRYAIRYPGDFTPGWDSPHYIVCTNHQVCDYSYDANNSRTDVPMTIFTTAGQGSHDRFWTLMWDMKHHHGKIDKYMAMHIMRGSYKYDKETGVKIEAGLGKDGRPAPWYLIGESTDRYLDATWGTNDGKVAMFDGESYQVCWTLGRPSDWEGAWDAYHFDSR
jgi:hypothetical protein